MRLLEKAVDHPHERKPWLVPLLIGLVSSLLQASFTHLVKFILARYLHIHNPHYPNAATGYNPYNPYQSAAMGRTNTDNATGTSSSTSGNSSTASSSMGPNRSGNSSHSGSNFMEEPELTDDDVLNWTIRSVGLYAHAHTANQDSMHWGEPPTSLALLVTSCPFKYFSNPQLQVSCDCAMAICSVVVCLSFIC